MIKSTVLLLLLLFYIPVFLVSYSVGIRSTTYHCPTPKLANGKVRMRNRSRFVKYTCNLGYMLSGDKYSNCVHGKWDGAPPKCVRPGCRQVSPPMNGLIFASHMNGVLHFYCKSGFDLHGPNITHCNGTVWSSNKPICLPTSTKPPLSCDFERADLCGWTHDLNHDFDWRRMKFSTPSGAIGTGPAFDHTLGEDKGGYYMYIESSSRNENDTARLISPVYERTSNDTCFQFFYHMYGTTIGSLRAYLKLVNETWNLTPEKAFFVKSGNQGNRWIEYVHLFEAIPNDFQIIIEGVRGHGYVSDIAIDDVRIIENCTVLDFRTPSPRTTASEFESSEGSTTTETYPDDFFSCEDKCFSTEIQMGAHRQCACDENCYDRNQCCPDYVDFCIIRSNSTENLDTFPVSTSTLAFEERKHQTAGDVDDTSPSPTSLMSHETTLSATKKIITTVPSQKTNSTITTTTTINDERTSSSIVSREPTERKKIVSKIPHEAESPVTRNMEHFKKQKTIITVQGDENNDRSFLLCLGFSLFFIVSSTMIAATVIVKKRRKSSRRNGFSHGDSASDVRFLTNDEMLDFNLDY